MCFPVIIPSIQIVSRMRCVLDLAMLTLGQFSIECQMYSGLPWLCFTPFNDWFRKPARCSKPIRCQTKTDRDLVARVFPHFWLFFCFYLESSLANDNVNI